MDSAACFPLHLCCPPSTDAKEIVALHARPVTPFLSMCVGNSCVIPEAVRKVNAMSRSTPTAVVSVLVGKDCLYPSDLQSLCPNLVLGNLRVTQSAKPWVGSEEKAQGLL